ncbi:hypothetical protein [uncultured Ruthenibacterium sp.]|uniref:hypothetical protein n=1 Tax=uncultured Ruthenibacterium sp. TaxID=1905347 RepID=UPI00349E6D10
MQSATVYDLETFAPRQARQRRELKVVKNTKPLAKAPWQHLWIVKGALLAVMFLTLVGSLLYSQAKVTELGAAIDSQKAVLSDLESDYDYLTSQMEMKTNMKSVEEYATSQLGLVALDRSQITYVYGDDENSIVRHKTGLGQLANDVSQGILSFVEYIAP